MKRILVWLRRHPAVAAGLFQDALFLAGAATLVVGISKMHPPSAWIVTGALLMLPTLRASLRRSGKDRSP